LSELDFNTANAFIPFSTEFDRFLHLLPGFARVAKPYRLQAQIKLVADQVQHFAGGADLGTCNRLVRMMRALLALIMTFTITPTDSPR